MALGLSILGVVTAAFFSLLFLPSVTGPGRTEHPPAQHNSGGEGSGLVSAFDDAATRRYLSTLEETFPSVAASLEEEIEAVKQVRGSDNDLALLALRAGGQAIWSNLDRLSRADAQHVDVLLTHIRDGLQKLAATDAPYCMGDDLLAYAGLPKQELYRAVLDRAEYGSPLYEFAVSLNTRLLETIAAARAAPVVHSPLAAPDQQALQDVGLAIMTQTRLAQLLATEGKTRTEMDEVVSETDFCAFGLTLIDKTQALPAVTKGRLWATAIRLVESGAWRWYLYQLQAT